MKLKDLNINDTGTVAGYDTTDKSYRQKLLRMGLVKGAEFKVVRKAPLGDPIEIELRGYRLTLRGAEADVLEVNN
jgi:ferrous iron transport protein A